MGKRIMIEFMFYHQTQLELSLALMVKLLLYMS